MASPFRLLVYAIVAIAVTGLAYMIFVPWLFPLPDNIELIEKSLRASETGQGKSFISETYFQNGEGFAGESFDTSSRNVAFICNNASLCCPRDRECSLPIEWEGRQIKFNESRTVLVTTRCQLDFGLFACTVYVGEKPAQIEIDSVQVPEEADLSGGAMCFEVQFSNTGNQDAFETVVSIEVFEKYFEDGKWRERAYEEASESVVAGELKAKQSMQKTVCINLNQNGPFRAMVKAAGLEAGFDEKSVQFTAINAPGSCMPAYCEMPELSSGKCMARCQCQNCMLGSKCAEVLLDSDPVDLFQSTGIGTEGAQTEILGSDIVDLILQTGPCLPSDIPTYCIIEPTADPDDLDPTCVSWYPEDYWIDSGPADPDDVVIQ